MTTSHVIIKQNWFGGNKIENKDKDKSDKELELSDNALKVARKELREDRSAREQGLDQLRNWLKKNEDVENVRTDTNFLLRFLRAKKFSVPIAEQCLLKYLNLRRVFPQMTQGLDYLSPKLKEIMTNSYLVVSPIRDQYGRRVIIARASKFNPRKNTSYDMAKAYFIVLETLLEDPENQVLGFTHVCDITGITAAHITNWNPTDFARILKWGEQSLPARHKSVHCVNVPSTVKFVLDFAKSKVSPKMKERFQAHTSVYELHKKVDKSCLPLEMGGMIPIDEMINSWIAEMDAKRDNLIALDKMILHSDRGIVRRHGDKNNNNSNDKYAAMQANFESLSGSFRKLEVD